MVHHKSQKKQFYISVIKNIARIGAGSALLLVHVAWASGQAIVAHRANKRVNAQKTITHEN